jgi:3-oxoacyl-[acyl-carrier protein] reductase
MGHRVASFARSATPAVVQLQSRHPDGFLFRELDGANGDQLEAFVNAAVECFGCVHGLVNNAAVGQDHLLANIPPELVARIVAVNVTGPILLTRLVVRHMLLAHPGHARIVNIGSICGKKAYAGLTVYAATKAALEGFTRTLAAEVGPRGILVNEVAPGFFESEMSASLSREQIDTVRRRTPTGSLTKPAELLPVLDLLLLGGSNITGQTIYVDGGAAL